MSELISGKEALNNWNESQVNNTRHQDSYWCDLKHCGFTIPEIMACQSNGMDLIFRLKPRTITINGIELNKPKKIQNSGGRVISILCENEADAVQLLDALKSIFSTQSNNS